MKERLLLSNWINYII